MNFFLEIIAWLIAGVIALMGILLFTRLHWPAPMRWVMKLLAAALSPLFTLLSAVILASGLISAHLPLIVTGVLLSIVFTSHMYRVTRPAIGFDKAFGEDWLNRIPAYMKDRFLSGRYVGFMRAESKHAFEQNLCFATLPETGRKLFCDIWRPSESVASSGLAFIYLHGAAWSLLDKDLGTRPFFKHLVAQGHVIMDVAYRLAPETDMMGMVQDANRAIQWMKKNAKIYGVNVNRIVIGGGSSGAHIAMLAAYTRNDYRFAAGVHEGDLDVCGVVSLYGPSDLAPMYYHLNQHITTRRLPDKKFKKPSLPIPGWVKRRMGSNYYRFNMDKGADYGSFVALFGCHPDECPGTYALLSPVNHIHANCPPTLLIHGRHDVLVPVNTTRNLYKKLVEKNIPTLLHIIPQSDHAFDLILPGISPSAQNAIFDVERFLGFLAGCKTNHATENKLQAEAMAYSRA